MSPPLLGLVEGEEGDRSNVALLASSTSSSSVMDSLRRSSADLKVRNYMGLPDSSSSDGSIVSDESKANLNLKATELRLGLPGSQSPDRSPERCLLGSAQLDEKPFFPLHPTSDAPYTSAQKHVVISGNKRGFSDVMDEGKFATKSDANGVLSGSALENPGTHLLNAQEVASPALGHQKSHAAKDNQPNHNVAANNSSAPASKAQVVGWPPIRNFRKNSLATTSKNTEEVDGKAGPGTLFVKVSMDGAPYLRKVDLRNYSVYQDLSSALEKMFSCFTIGQYGSHGASGREMLSESKLKDLLHGSEYVLTYEDKDGDWMLVGDVPWEMFIDTCKRLRIMKSSDAIGLAPRAVEKCKSRT